MLSLLLAVTLTLAPATQTVSGLPASVQVVAAINTTSTIAKAAWSAASSDIGRWAAPVEWRSSDLKAKGFAPSSVKLPAAAPLTHSITQSFDLIFTKQGVYNLVFTVTAADGSIARQGVTVNVKRK